MTSFADRVRSVVAKIPRGQTMTYAQVAEAAESPRAYRAVGAVMKGNYDADIPCHRVVRSDGQPGEYNRGADEKIKLLKQEGAL